jgi:hypothetical protein
MGQFFNGLLTFGAVCAVAFLCLTLPAVATPPPIRIRQRPPSRRMTTKMIPPNPRRKGTTPTRPMTKANPMWPPPPDAKAEDAPPAATGEIQSAVKMKDWLGEGFLIRTTVLVPTDAVTRQLGKASPDAIILTLQRETAIAVCYYTLKAYVKESLTDIASCTVFR